MQKRTRSTTQRLNELLSTSQNKSYFVAAVTVLFTVIMALVGIIPAYSAFSFQNEENERRDILIEKLEKKLKTSQSLSTEYNNKGDLVEYFSEVFPSEPNQANIVDVVEEIAVSNSSRLLRLTFNKNPSPSFTQKSFEQQIQSQQVNATIEGSQIALLNVIKDVENSRRNLNINSMSLSRKNVEELTQEDVGFEYTITLQMEYYYFDNTLTTEGN